MRTFRALATALLIALPLALSQCTTPSGSDASPEQGDLDTVAIMGRWQRCESMDRYEGLSKEDWDELVELQGDPAIEGAEGHLRAGLRLMENHKGLIYSQPNYSGDYAEVEWAIRTADDPSGHGQTLLEIVTQRNGEREVAPHAVMLEDSTLYLGAIYKARLIGALQADLASMERDMEQVSPSEQQILLGSIEETKSALRMLDTAPNFIIWRAYRR